MIAHAEMEALRAQFDAVATNIGERLAAVSPRFVALVAKWSKEDLVPGLSDMDFRVICDDAATADDWIQIDWHVGRIHREMVEEHPEWNRINEHTAGAGVSLAELDDRRFHHPEYSMWRVWWGRREWAEALQGRTLKRTLSRFDEHQHLMRFLSYYSPYIHGIDPPINLGQFEPKYALHSRCWHYFAPPMLSAATLLARRHFTGKREALHWLADHGFAKHQVHAVFEQVDAHYETRELTDPARLSRFENLLFDGFNEVLRAVYDSIEFLDVDHKISRRSLLALLSEQSADPLVDLMENVRFTRIRAGRYYFYLNAPSHFSATQQLVQEQAWTRKLINATLKLLRQLQGQVQLTAEECFQRLGVVLNEKQHMALQFALSLAESTASGNALRNDYARAIDILPHYYQIVEDAFEQVLTSDRYKKAHVQSGWIRIDDQDSILSPVNRKRAGINVQS